MTLYALWTAAGTLLLLWIIGVCGGIDVGGWIHLALIAAVLMIGASLLTRPHPV
ncbi:MAG TPA: DUF5670 family protein [Polyangia bacterium]|jgi:hypothetical protein